MNIDKFNTFTNMTKKQVKLESVKVQKEIIALARQLSDKIETLNLLNAIKDLGAANLDEILYSRIQSQQSLNEDYDSAYTLKELSSLNSHAHAANSTVALVDANIYGGASLNSIMKSDKSKHKLNPTLAGIRFKAHYPMERADIQQIQDGLQF